jgi:hypothetical protein
MADDRLPTALWIDAHLHQLNKTGTFYYILNKGAYASGTVMIKLFAPGKGAMVLQQQRDPDGVMGWLALFDGVAVEEARADDYVRRAISRDPDLWVIEVEDRALKNPFEGKIF